MYWIDQYGLAPGDLFKDYGGALADARAYIERLKYYQMIEYGGWFYKVGQCWTYNLIPGTPDGVSGDELDDIKPGNPFSGWHSHPGRGAGNPTQQVHSQGDMNFGTHHGVPAVLFPPDGGATSYDPASGSITPLPLPNPPPPGGDCECNS